MYIPREQRGAVFTSIHGHTWIFFLFSLHTSRAECRCAITTRKSWQIFFLSKVNFHGRFFFWARSVSTYDHVYFMYTRMYTHSMYVCMYVCVYIRMYTHRIWISWKVTGPRTRTGGKSDHQRIEGCAGRKQTCRRQRALVTLPLRVGEAARVISTSLTPAGGHIERV